MRNINNIEQEVEYINKVLRGKKRGFGRIAKEDYGVNDIILLDVFKANGYQKVKNQIVRTIDITDSNIEVIEPNRQVIEPIKEVTTIIPEKEAALININTEKLNVLLDNLEDLLKLIPKENSIYRSNDNRVVSIRLDSGLYNESKHRAEMCNITVTELFNRALENYLK